MIVNAQNTDINIKRLLRFYTEGSDVLFRNDKRETNNTKQVIFTDLFKDSVHT